MARGGWGIADLGELLTSVRRLTALEKAATERFEKLEKRLAELAERLARLEERYDGLADRAATSASAAATTASSTLIGDLRERLARLEALCASETNARKQLPPPAHDR